MLQVFLNDIVCLFDLVFGLLGHLVYLHGGLFSNPQIVPNGLKLFCCGEVDTKNKCMAQVFLFVTQNL